MVHAGAAPRPPTFAARPWLALEGAGGPPRTKEEPWPEALPNCPLAPAAPKPGGTRTENKGGGARKPGGPRASPGVTRPSKSELRRTTTQPRQILPCSLWDSRVPASLNQEVLVASNPRPPSALNLRVHGSPRGRARPAVYGYQWALRKDACVVEGTQRTGTLTWRRLSPVCPSLAVKMALSRVCWARAALWGSAVPPGLYVVRRLQFVRSGLTWGAPRWGTWREKNIFDVQALPVSQYCLHAVLILRALRPGPWIFILPLRSRTRIPARDLASWPSQFSAPRVAWILHVSRAALFGSRFYCCLPGSHLSGFSLLLKLSLRPAFSRLTTPPTFILVWPLICLICFSQSNCLSLRDLKIFLGFQKFQVLAYILWSLCFTFTYGEGSSRAGSQIVSFIFLVGLQSFIFLQRQMWRAWSLMWWPRQKWLMGNTIVSWVVISPASMSCIQSSWKVKTKLK